MVSGTRLQQSFLIMTSSPQTHLLRNTRGFQTSMSKSSTKTHKYLSWLLSGLLSTVPLPFAFLPMEKTSRPNVQERSAIRSGTDRAGGNYPLPPINCGRLEHRGGTICQDMPVLTICSHQGFPSAWLTVGRRGGNSGQIFAKLLSSGLTFHRKGTIDS